MKNFWILAICLAGCNESGSEPWGASPAAEEEPAAPPAARVSIGELEYPSLEAAALAAQPGDQIDLGEGTATLRSTLLLLEGVTIAGAGPHLTTIVGSIQVVPADSMARIHHLAVTSGGVGIDAAGCFVDIWNVLLRDLDVGLSVPAGSNARVNFVTAIRNRVAFDIGAAPFKSSNCIVNENGTGMRADPAANAACRYNNLADNGIDYDGVVPGEGSTSNSIPFLADGREPDGAPNVDAGDPSSDFSEEPEDNGDRVNQGAFGNTPWAARTR